MFVHDFTAVAGPVQDATGRFASLEHGVLAQAVVAAWNRHAPVLCAQLRSPAAAFELTLTSVDVRVQRPHFRGSTAIVNLVWSSPGWLPDLDADLELVQFGAASTHLHLMGRYELPDAVERFSEEGSLVQRVMVMVVRSFLTDLATLLETNSG